jgi:protoporphyrinogen oxidase
MGSRIVILGAGLAGLSAAYHLKNDYEIFEKRDRVGGLCRSETIDGFTFDYAIHILYSSNPYATNLIRQVLLKDQLHIQKRSSWVFSKGVFTFYPFQANTYGLPIEVVEECVLGLIEAVYERDPQGAANFEEWVYRTFGDGIAKHFMIPFNEKCWAIDLKKMSIGWIKDRVLQPELREVLHGALTDQRKGFGPNAEFWYPVSGGIEALPRGFLPYLDPDRIHLETEVVSIHSKEKRIRIASGETIPYEALISSLPLPNLVDLLDEVPQAVRRARGRLENNTIWGVNLCLDCPPMTDKHWIYYPEPEVVFHRISFPMNFHPSMVPEGKSSITAEVATSRYKAVDLSTMVSRVIEDLKHLGFVKSERDIIGHNVLELTPAYVIYHLEHRRDVDLLHEYLRARDIYPCGRFGDWEYLNMDASILSGKRAAEQVLERA